MNRRLKQAVTNDAHELPPGVEEEEEWVTIDFQTQSIHLKMNRLKQAAAASTYCLNPPPHNESPPTAHMSCLRMRRRRREEAWRATFDFQTQSIHLNPPPPPQHTASTHRLTMSHRQRRT